MTDHTKRTVRGTLFALLTTVAIGYGIVSWSLSPSMAQPTISATIEDLKLHNPELLQAFYQERGMRTIWLRGATDFQPRARAAVDLLQNSWTHGLNPENYHVPRLVEMASMKEGLDRNQFDLLLSDGIIRYARDLTGMRGKHNPNERADKYWRQPMDAQQILEEVVESGDPVNKLKSLEQNGKLYQALREELVMLGGMTEDEAPVKIPAGLKPGRSHAGVVALRQKIASTAPVTNPEIYDDELAAEIMKLQRSYSQRADGVLRAETLTAINRSAKDKMMQIIANMERLRWMEQGRPDRYILVNIPSASLWAVEDGEVAMEMPVIIGKTARPTYSFKTEITGVRFNPNWTVPPTIKNKDFLPMLQQDPEALNKRGIRITYQGQLVDPTKVDWSTVTSKGLSQVKMIQNPGDDNPLGKVRVIMENPYNIYLHDTNHRELFDADERALSSGCIRVQQPEKLADFILRDNDGWTWNGMQKMIDSGRMRDVSSDVKTPVYITYQTIWLDSEGKLIYGRDVYGQDARLGEILKKAAGIHIPQSAEKAEISL